MNSVTLFSVSFITLAIAIYILMAAKIFFIPILVALIITYFIVAISTSIQRFLGRKLNIPRWLSLVLALCFIFVILTLVVSMITRNVSELVSSAPVYEENLKYLYFKFFEYIGKPAPDIMSKLREFDIGAFITNVVFTMTDIIGSAGLITIYVIFMVIESYHFNQKLTGFFDTESGKRGAIDMMDKITGQIRSYVLIKSLLSLLTATISYLIMIAVGVDLADFWALMIFILNFIPTIGSILATIFPCLLTLIQFNAVAPFLTVSVCLILVQFVVGNMIEPKIMGKHFNLSGLVIILSLTIWSNIWGVIGMFLCVPIMMVVSIILANFQQTRPIAIALSSTGKLES